MRHSRIGEMNFSRSCLQAEADRPWRSQINGRAPSIQKTLGDSLPCPDANPPVRFSELLEKPDQAEEPIAAACRFAAIAVENPHPKVVLGIEAKQDQAVGADPELSHT